MGNLTASIEKSLIFHNSDSANETMFSTFNMILQAITTSPSQNALFIEMEKLFSNPITARYFKYGFGSNHMWLVQRILNSPSNPEVRVDSNERILIVKF